MTWDFANYAELFINLFLFSLQYELRLEATRNRKNNYTTVVINVRDVNDNPPVFDRQTYRTQITEEDDRNLPKRILQVCSSDRKALPIFSGTTLSPYWLSTI